MRRDVLALTEEDLIALSNRGTVKKAIRTWDKGQTAVTFQNESEALSASLSSGETVTFPASGGLQQATCTCPKAFGWCVHRVVAVLAYQTQMADVVEEAEPVAWHPADITDKQLKTLYRTQTLNKHKRTMNEGHVFALTTGIQPTARLLTQGCTVRFMVANEVSNARCNCAEQFPCSHIPQAVWAFRQLDGEQGLVETRSRPLSIPTHILKEIQQNLIDLAELGLGGMAQATNGRLSRLATRCQHQDLVWISTLLTDILAQHQLYHSQSARFSELTVAHLLGELLVRLTAVEQPSPHIPPSFVRGTRQETSTRINTVRVQGLGANIQTTPNSTQLTLYFQAVDSGERVALQQSIENKEQALPYWQIAQQNKTQDESWSRLSGAQLLVSGKKQANNLLSAQKIAISPPDWSLLRAPVLVDDYAELNEQLALLPPSCLRPRRIGDDLFVLPVAEVKQIGFDVVHQQVIAQLHDGVGGTAVLRHPYTTRGRKGVDRLLAHLKHPLQWVAGRARWQNGQLFVRPISLLFQVGKQTVLVQPHIDQEDTNQTEQLAQMHPRTDPIPVYLEALQKACGELLLVGVRRVDTVLIRQWQELAHQADKMGFVRLTQAVSQLANHLAKRQDVVQWQWQTAVDHLFHLLPLVRMAEEL